MEPKSNNSKGKRDHRKEMVDRIIGMMEKAGEWDRPWMPSGLRPHNPVTGTIYRGINALSLMCAGFEDDGRFMTFNNIKELSKKAEKAGLDSIRLRKGEKGTPIFKAVKINVGGKSEDAEDSTAQRSFMVYAYAGTVFNASQVDGLPPAPTSGLTEGERVERAEFAIQSMCEETGLKWEETRSDRACYSVSLDKVVVPLREQFSFLSEFYSTALHELGHATGHPDRLNRNMSTGVGRNMDAYAFEELIAELTSYFTAAETGVPYSGKTHESHASYLKSWAGGLREDKNLLFKACSQAAKASDFIAKIANEHREKLTSNEVFGDEVVPKSFGTDAEFEPDRTFDFSDVTSEDDIMDDINTISQQNAYEVYGIDIDSSFTPINSDEFRAGF